MGSFTSLMLILLFFGAGYLTSRLIQVPAAVPQRTNFFVIYWIFPAVILLNIPPLQIQSEFLFLSFAPWLIAAITTLVLVLAQRHYGWSRETLGACLILATLGNTGYLGFPMLRTFFSDQQAGMGIIFDQLGTFIVFCTFGSVVLSLFATNVRFSWAGVFRRIFLFPPFITLLVAFVLPESILDTPLATLLRWLSYTIIPLTMFSIGLQFNFRGLGDNRGPLIWTLSLKMLVAPLAVWTAGILLGVSDVMLDVAVFQSAMPPVVAGAVMLMAQGLAPRFAVTVLGIGTLAALAYLPLVAWLLNSL